MYTKILKKLLKISRQKAGHCVGDGGGHVGHCY
jgi:hypothetical protein